MIDAVLFDWEGTLADTASIRRESLLHALAGEGMPVDPIAYHTLCDGRTVPDASANMLAHSGRRDPTLVELVTLRAQRGFAERLATGFTLSAGASEFVARLQQRTRVAIVTGASRTETDLFLRLSGLRDAASTIVTADDVMNPPPAPDLYARAVTQLNRARLVNPDRIIAVATTAFAIRAAHAAGLRTVAMNSEPHVALDGDGAADGVDGLGLTELARLANIHLREQQA